MVEDASSTKGMFPQAIGFVFSVLTALGGAEAACGCLPTETLLSVCGDSVMCRQFILFSASRCVRKVMKTQFCAVFKFILFPSL